MFFRPNKTAKSISIFCVSTKRNKLEKQKNGVGKNKQLSQERNARSRLNLHSSVHKVEQAVKFSEEKNKIFLASGNTKNDFEKKMPLIYRQILS